MCEVSNQAQLGRELEALPSQQLKLNQWPPHPCRLQGLRAFVSCLGFNPKLMPT